MSHTWNHVTIIYKTMANIYHTPISRIDNYGRVTVSSKQPTDFNYLLGMNLNDITPFDNGTDELLEQGATILPRHYYIFAGTVDNEYMYKTYEFDQYRIVVSIIHNIITCIDSIG